MNKLKYDIENKRINEILDELGEEYKDLLIEKALSQHKEYDVNQINISTLLKLDEKTKESLVTDEHQYKRNRYLSMLSIIGLFYTLFGLILLIYNQIGYSIKYEPMTIMSLLSIFIGLFATLFSMLMKNFPYSSYYKNKETSKYFNYDIVNTWKQIEGLLIQLTPTEENVTLNNMISSLLDLKLLSKDDALSIKKLLRLRNQIVHSDNVEKQYTTNEIQSLLSDAHKIIRKLQKFENS